MATFHPNPNYETEPWIERPAIEGSIFRIWHLIFFCFSACLVLVTLIFCCVKIRVPRTKQEIEADYQRKKITRKFKDRLQQFENHTMDTIDLKKALDIMLEDFKTVDVKKLDEHLNQEYNYFNPNTTTDDLQEHQSAEQSNKGINKLITLMKIKVKSGANKQLQEDDS